MKTINQSLNPTKAIIKIAIKYSKEQFTALALTTNTYNEDGGCISTETTTYYDAPLDSLQEALNEMLPYAIAIARLAEEDWQEHGFISGVAIKRDPDMEITGYCATAQLRHPDDGGAVQCISTRFVPYESMGREEEVLEGISAACLSYIAGNRKVSQLDLFEGAA